MESRQDNSSYATRFGGAKTSKGIFKVIVTFLFPLYLTHFVFSKESDGSKSIGDRFQTAEHEILIKRGVILERTATIVSPIAQTGAAGIDSVRKDSDLLPTQAEARAALVELAKTSGSDLFSYNRDKLVKELQTAPFIPHLDSERFFRIGAILFNFNTSTFTFGNLRGRFVRDEEGQWRAETVGRMPIGEPSRRGSSGGKGG